MVKYANEAAFSRALVKEMRKRGCFVQRGESHATGRGIPDIYAVTLLGRAMWLELKRIKHNVRDVNEITWRPGQQAWLWEVSRKYKQEAYTLVAFDDCLALIEHKKIYPSNLVPRSLMTLFSSLTALLTA